MDIKSYISFVAKDFMMFDIKKLLVFAVLVVGAPVSLSLEASEPSVMEREKKESEEDRKKREEKEDQEFFEYKKSLVFREFINNDYTPIFDCKPNPFLKVKINNKRGDAGKTLKDTSSGMELHGHMELDIELENIVFSKKQSEIFDKDITEDMIKKVIIKDVCASFKKNEELGGELKILKEEKSKVEALNTTLMDKKNILEKQLKQLNEKQPKEEKVPHVQASNKKLVIGFAAAGATLFTLACLDQLCETNYIKKFVTKCGGCLKSLRCRKHKVL